MYLNLQKVRPEMEGGILKDMQRNSTMHSRRLHIDIFIGIITKRQQNPNKIPSN